MTWNDFKEELLRDQKFAKVFHQSNLAQDIADRIFCARVAQGITQKQLGGHIGTTQSGIARIERGASLPSITTLKKIADVLKLELAITLVETKHRRETEDVLQILNEYLPEGPFRYTGNLSFITVSGTKNASRATMNKEIYD